MLLNWEDLGREFERELEIDDINDYIEIVGTSVDSKIRQIQVELEAAKPGDFRSEYEFSDHQDHFSEMWSQKESTKRLVSELAIGAIYKRVEIHTVHLVKKYMHLPDSTKISSITDLEEIVPFPLNRLAEYAAFEELRLLNNAIKHEGKITKILANAFPNWIEGSDFGDLEGAYRRLAPRIKAYARAFVTQLQALP